jgi:hypothetical protein
MGWLKMQVAQHALGLLIAPLALVVMQQLKRMVAQIDTLDAWPKRLVVVVLSAVFVALGKQLGVDFGVNGEDVSALATISQQTIETALAAGLAMGLHSASKAAKKKPDAKP